MADPTAQDQLFDFYVAPQLAAQRVTEALRSRAPAPIYALGSSIVYDSAPTTPGGTPLIAGGLWTANDTPKPDFYAFETGRPQGAISETRLLGRRCGRHPQAPAR